MCQISIIIPVYNKIKYLATMLEDVRNQSFRDFECILIDDGSSDGSGAVCDQFAAEDSRFRVVHIPNGGVSHARNMGLDMAQGEYLTFLDSDDRIHQEFLQNLYDCMVNSGADMVIGTLERVWEETQHREIIEIPYSGKYSMEQLLPEFASVQQSVGIYGFCCAKLVRRSLVADLRFDEQIHLAEDLDFYVKLYPRVSTICFDTKPYYYYVQAAENSSMLDPGNGIDYITQLAIQKRINDFLEKTGALCGENERVMNRRLYDYVYFSLFHSPVEAIWEKYEQIQKLSLPKCTTIGEMASRQRWIVNRYGRNQIPTLARELNFYRWVRSLKRRCLHR